jgi:L-lactate dehydrogenase complex protein LldG
MTSRNAFLQRVREAVAKGNRPGAPRELPPRGSAGYQGAAPDPVRTFAEQLIALGGHCHVVSTPAEAIARILELLQNSNATKILIGKDLPMQLGLAGVLRAANFDVWNEASASKDESTKPTLFAADAGVTGVDWLIAETGTMVITTRDGKGRSLSLLPPVHIAVATRDQLLPDLFDLFSLSPLEERGRGEGADLPACITLITGPSKTGDIELRLVTGVHGPGEVHLVLIA